MPHIHNGPGEIDLTVEVFVVCEERVLLRFHDKLDMWLSVDAVSPRPLVAH